MTAVIAFVAASLLSGCPDAARMAHVPGGSFWVREARWFDTERPRERLTLHAFCIDRLLVTQDDYARFVAADGALSTSSGGVSSRTLPMCLR